MYSGFAQVGTEDLRDNDRRLDNMRLNLQRNLQGFQIGSRYTEERKEILNQIDKSNLQFICKRFYGGKFD